MRIEKLTESTKKNLLEDLLKRSPNSYGKYEASVQQILNDVKEKGNEALFGYTEKFDGVKLDASQILVTDAEIEEAYTEVGEELLGIIRKALVNIRTYHESRCNTVGSTASRMEPSSVRRSLHSRESVSMFRAEKRLIRLPY